MRSRYRHLRDPIAPDGPLQPGLEPSQWREVLDLETEGDLAIRRGDHDRARKAFTQLAEHESTAGHRVVRIHALIGAGDVARAVDEVDSAIAAYEEALSLSVTDRYRFGQLRALVPLGYLTIAYASAGTATERFTLAESLAAELEDPLYRANAALGLADCAERSGDLNGAIDLASTAYTAFEQVGSPIGKANAAHRTGALLHRAGRLAEASPWLEQAHSLYVEIRDPVGLTNVLSGLGDLHLDRQDFEPAERWYTAGLQEAKEARLPRARAHALQDIARLARGRGQWADAVTKFEQALAAYREIDDINGVTHALDKIAEAQAELEQPDAVVRTRLESVFSVEAFRAAHRDERSQREYRNRFAQAYSRALAAAITHGDANVFAVVADCLAGRRLAGLIEAGAPTSGQELELLQGLLAHADQRLVQHRRQPRDVEGESRREQRIRLLGSMGIRYGLADKAELSLDDQLAAVYLPPERDGAPLLASAPTGAHLLQLLADPTESDRIGWLWRPPGEPPRLGFSKLDGTTRELLDTLCGDESARIQLHIWDLRPLASVLPPGFTDSLMSAPEQRLLIVPVGELWMIPWSAVPLSDQTVLGEHVRYAVCPSLMVQRLLAARAAEAGTPISIDGDTTVDVWRSPLVEHHDLTGIDTDARLDLRPLPSSAEARARLRDGGEMMVVIGHGRPAPGMGHYLEFDHADWLVPADLLGASTPRRLALLACGAGSISQTRPSDPISLATLALAARSDEVLATVGELGDSHPAARYAEQILNGMAHCSLPDALHRATRWLLSDGDMRAEPIFHWAPLIPVGTVLDAA
ncbi:hypothetical protein FraQA3DRAFT_1389 [Frankia sp. QA3]|nr:hypothetical protein FraQA3DRAFT_1389 [Frankia sp. QA3]